jgi:hypothetical protein
MAVLKVWFILVFILLFETSVILAQVETITVTHKYVGGDNDSRNDARRMCFLEAKRKVLAKAGTYIQSKTTIKNYQLTEDTMTAFSAAILKMEIIKEDWGQSGYNPTVVLTVKADFDTSVLEKQLAKMQKDTIDQEEIKQKLKELEEKFNNQKSQPGTETSPIQKPLTKIGNSSDWPWWYWAVGAVVVGALGVALTGSSDDSSSSGSSESCPAGAGNCGSTVITW